jgi:hypothetical protein
MVGALSSCNFSELGLEPYDYTRCVREDGTAYGTSGKCRKGTKQAKEVATKKPKRAKATKTPRKTKSTGAKVKPSKKIPIELNSSLEKLTNKLKETTIASSNKGQTAKQLVPVLSKDKAVSNNNLGSPVKTIKTQGSRGPMKEKYNETEAPELRLSKIYEAQGFNSKPELVKTRAALEQRKDIIVEPDGKPLILYRGLTEESFARQLLGLGPEGGKHFPGKGVNGNGTYAASVGKSLKGGDSVRERTIKQVQNTAVSYSGGKEGASKRVVALALRSDANVVQFEGKDYNAQYLKYRRWTSDILKKASERFGVPFSDSGEAAAAMGIHAYRVPATSEENYWVILNRGAVIAAQDPELYA